MSAAMDLSQDSSFSPVWITGIAHTIELIIQEPFYGTDILIHEPFYETGIPLQVYTSIR